MLTISSRNIFSEISHVEFFPWTINGEEYKSGEGKVVDLVISMSNFLTNFLCGGIKTRQIVGPITCIEWVFNVESINRVQRSLNDQILSLVKERS